MAAIVLADGRPAMCMHAGFTRFIDRADAGTQLAAELAAGAGSRPLVLGIPRGGVPVAAAVAAAIGGELDVVVARKLGAPGQPELAIGAVTAEGDRYLDETAIAALGVDPVYLAAETLRETARARRQEERFRAGRPAPRIAGRTVIVVDDGLATGATMRAALRALRRRHPGRLIAAAPVGSREACAALCAEADAVVCPVRPDPFWAVGHFYEAFEPVPDGAVEQLLARAHAAAPVDAHPAPA